MSTYPEYQHITTTQSLVDAAPIQIRNMNLWGTNGYQSGYNQTVFTGATSTYYDAYHNEHFPLYDAKCNDYEYTRRINLAYGPTTTRSAYLMGDLLQANGNWIEGMNAWYDLREIISRFPNIWIQGFKFYSTGTFLTSGYVANNSTVEYGLQGSYWVTYILGNSYPYNRNNVSGLPFRDSTDTTDVIVQQIKPFGRTSDEIRFSFGDWIHFNTNPLLIPMAYIAFSDQLMPPVPIVIDDSGNNGGTIPPVTPIDNGDGDTGVIIDDQGNTTPIDNNNNNSGNQNGYNPPVDNGSSTQNNNNNSNSNAGTVSNQNDSGMVSQNVNYYPVQQQCAPQRRGLYYEEDYYNKDADGGVVSLRRILAMFNW